MLRPRRISAVRHAGAGDARPAARLRRRRAYTQEHRQPGADVAARAAIPAAPAASSSAAAATALVRRFRPAVLRGGTAARGRARLKAKKQCISHKLLSPAPRDHLSPSSV